MSDEDAVDPPDEDLDALIARLEKVLDALLERSPPRRPERNVPVNPRYL